MTFAAVIPALQTVGTLASLAGTVVSAITGASQSASSSSKVGADSAKTLDQMQGLLQRQQETQLQTMEMQTQANVQKMLADTANSIASGHLDSGNKVQNAVHKAAQGIQF